MSSGEQKTTTDKLGPFMCPFNKVHLHSYLTTLFQPKDEQLPHAKHSLHLHVQSSSHINTPTQREQQKIF